MSWPFACWGLDMIGPFKPAPGGFRYVYIAVDKFSKWIEYKPLVLATAKKAVEHFEDIIHRFGLSNSIITNLRTIFTGHHFWDFCENDASPSNTSLLAIPEPMARSNGRMA